MAKNVRETAKTEFELTRKNSYKIKKKCGKKNCDDCDLEFL